MKAAKPNYPRLGQISFDITTLRLAHLQSLDPIGSRTLSINIVANGPERGCRLDGHEARTGLLNKANQAILVGPSRKEKNAKSQTIRDCSAHISCVCTRITLNNAPRLRAGHAMLDSASLWDRHTLTSPGATINKNADVNPSFIVSFLV